MNDPVEEVLRKLRSRGIEAKRSGPAWSARCPAHEDRNPSLSIAAGDDGRALVYCHAGCDVRDVARALGMELSDLFSRERGPAWTPRRYAKPRSTPARRRPSRIEAPEKTYPSAEAALGVVPGRSSPLWLYHDGAGQVVAAVARFDRGDSGKTFRQASINSAGLWIAKGIPSPRPLYRLPDLLAGTGDVFVVEGEKCADAIARLGLASTTSVGGATNAHHSDWTPLRGRRVIVLPDADEQGDRYASDVARLAGAAGAAEVRLLRMAVLWPEVPPKGDVADWIAFQACRGDQSLREELVRCAESAPTACGSPPSSDGITILSQRVFPRRKPR